MHPWTDMFSKHTNAVCNGCVLTFKYQHVRSGQSRKRFCSFVNADAHCNGQNCSGKFRFVIDTEPSEDTDVTVKCYVTGNICHSSEEINRRHLAGQGRNVMALAMKTTSATNQFYKNVFAGDEKQLEKGNFTEVPNRTVLRKIVSEEIKKKQFHQNVITEVQVLKEVFEKQGESYIRDIG